MEYEHRIAKCLLFVSSNFWEKRIRIALLSTKEILIIIITFEKKISKQCLFVYNETKLR